jgi:YD repeat-containing protein
VTKPQVKGHMGLVGGGGTTTVTDPTGRQIADAYANGELVSQVRGAGTSQAATWLYHYDQATLGVSEVTDPAGHSSRATFDQAGNMTSSTDALGRKTSFTSDALNDLTSRSLPSGLTTSYAYDGSGNLLLSSSPAPITDMTPWPTSPPGPIRMATRPPTPMTEREGC